MAQLTTTRMQLRRKIARALQMHFFQIYDDGYLEFEDTLAYDSFTHSAFVQIDNYWKNGWVLMNDNLNNLQYVRRCRAYTQGSKMLYVDQPMPLTTYHDSPKDTFEILDTFSPMLIHDAIDDAIQYAGRYFPKPILNYANFVLGYSKTGDADRIQYDLTLLDEAPWRINALYVPTEAGHTFLIRRTVLDGISILRVFLPTTITYADDAFNGWTFTCPNTSNGDGVTSTISDTVAYDAADPTNTGYVTIATPDMATNPAVNNFACILPNITTNPLYRITAFRTDTPEYPSQLRIDQPPSIYIGQPLLIEYETCPVKLINDSDTTTIPEQFILHHALSYLHEAMMNDNRSDMARHERLAGYHKQKADEYELKFPQRRPASSQQLDWLDQQANDMSDPLGWRT